MADLKSFNELLSAAAEIRDIPIEPAKEHISTIGKALSLIFIALSALIVFCCGEGKDAALVNKNETQVQIDFFEGPGSKMVRLYQTDYSVIDHHEKWIPALYIENNYQTVENHIQSLLNADTETNAIELNILYNVLGKVSQAKYVGLMQDTLDEWCRANPDSHIPWLVRGTFYINLAWHIRGSGYASSVSEDVWPKFYSNLELAQKDLKKSYKINPNDPNSSCNLITVAKGLSFDKDKMEQYFQNGLAACPWHLGLHIKKLDFIKPKWHGTYDGMLEFASRCLLESHKHPSLGLIMADALQEAHNLHRKKNENFLGKEENWKAIEKIYTNYFNRYPDDIRRRFNLAYHAYSAKKYDIAIKQFEIINDRWVEGTYWFSLNDYNRCRAFAYYRKGTKLLWDKKLYEISIEPFELSVKYRPTADGYYGLGIAYWSAGANIRDLSLIKKSETALQEALEIDPNHKNAKKQLKDLRKKLKLVKE